MERNYKIDSTVEKRDIFGNFDDNIKILQKEFSVDIFTTSYGLLIKGKDDDVKKCKKVLDGVIELVNEAKIVDVDAIEYLIYLVNEEKDADVKSIKDKKVVVTFSGNIIKPKTKTQLNYVENIDKNTLNFGIGPAGTGKTFLAVAMAVKYYKEKKIKKIILTRPAIEAGENLGFLPGDLQDKVDPYLRPLYDALGYILGTENYQKMKEKEIIEVAPLAYMRGRTLDDAFIILDEAQNTSKDQMKMFLTRFGKNSKVVVNGDITQIDLHRGKQSGLSHATAILKNINDISITKFSHKDVIRHKLVKKIIERYENSRRD